MTSVGYCFEKPVQTAPLSAHELSIYGIRRYLKSVQSSATPVLTVCLTSVHHCLCSCLQSEAAAAAAAAGEESDVDEDTRALAKEIRSRRAVAKIESRLNR